MYNKLISEYCYSKFVCLSQKSRHIGCLKNIASNIHLSYISYQLAVKLSDMIPILKQNKSSKLRTTSILKLIYWQIYVLNFVASDKRKELQIHSLKAKLITKYASNCANSARVRNDRIRYKYILQHYVETIVGLCRLYRLRFRKEIEEINNSIHFTITIFKK